MSDIPGDIAHDAEPTPATGTSPINELPNELLAHLFTIGTFDDILAVDIKAQKTPELPFQVLCSHICQRWRDVCLTTPILWSRPRIECGTRLEEIQAFLDRSGTFPLELGINCLAPPDWEEDLLVAEELRKYPFLHLPQQIRPILDLLIPHVSRWIGLEVVATRYITIHYILSRLSDSETVPSAPLLQRFLLYHAEELSDDPSVDLPQFQTRFIPFNGVVPNLEVLALWGAHIDWEGSLSFLSGLQKLELGYQTAETRPTWKTLSTMFTQSPGLVDLSLSETAPAGEPTSWMDDPDSPEFVVLPSLTNLSLSDHAVSHIGALLPRLVMPELAELELDYTKEDCSPLASILTQPMLQADGTRSKRSLLSSVHALRIKSLPCDDRAIHTIFADLANVRVLMIECDSEEEDQGMFPKLLLLESSSQTESEPTSAKRVLYCPSLRDLITIGIDGKRMRQLVEVRAAANAPLRRISMPEHDNVDLGDEEWLRQHVELETFIDSEEEYDSDWTDNDDSERDDDVSIDSID